MLQLVPMAGKVLASPLGRQLLGGAALSGGIAAAPAALDYATGKAARAAQDKALRGLKDPEGGYEDVSILDRFLYGDKVSTEAIDKRKGLKKAQAVSDQYKDALGSRFREGMTGAEAKRELQKVNREQANLDVTSSPVWLQQQKQYQDSRDDAAQARLDQLRESQLLRQDTLESRRDQLDFDRANLAFKQAESQRQFDLQSKRSHKEKMASILAGIAGLGAAFAI